MNAATETIDLTSNSSLRTDWTRKEIQKIYQQPFNDLLFQAQQVHRRFHDANKIQISTLLSIKTGACPEDCAYCPQSAHHNVDLEKERLLSLEEVTAAAQRAKDLGAERFCMGAAWRNPAEKALDRVIEMVEAVRELGLETCVTLGMLTKSQTQKLASAGLDYYNHNLDTSPEFYGSIITTRDYQDRLDTLENVRNAGINVCCGGIIGLGESGTDRIGLIHLLATLPKHPESVPINSLVQVEGTPLHGQEPLDDIEFVRTIATARITMPTSTVRLSAGRETMSDGVQALCFLAGANSVFYGEKLLTTANPTTEQDQNLFRNLGLHTALDADSAVKHKA